MKKRMNSIIIIKQFQEKQLSYACKLLRSLLIKMNQSLNTTRQECLLARLSLPDQEAHKKFSEVDCHYYLASLATGLHYCCFLLDYLLNCQHHHFALKNRLWVPYRTDSDYYLILPNPQYIWYGSSVVHRTSIVLLCHFHYSPPNTQCTVSCAGKHSDRIKCDLVMLKSLVLMTYRHHQS